MIRIAYLLAYAALAALGEALVARPALLFFRSQGLFRAAPAWEVPFGAVALALSAFITAFTIWLALDAALGHRPRVPQHAAFLIVVALSFALRWAGGEPRPPRDPAPSLLEGMRAAAAGLDRTWSGRYAPDAGQLNGALAQVASPGYRRLGRTLPLHARVLSASEGPQLEPLPGDEPATIYIAISRDRTTAWLTALGLQGILKSSSGKPALIEAHAGTHSLPGRDRLVPAYPGMRSVTQ